jgi:hypothetical protein
MSEEIVVVKGMSLKGIDVFDANGVQVYPKVFSYVVMQEACFMQRGSVYMSGIDYPAPFKFVRR